MAVIAKDVCVANGFRLTEFQIISGKEIIDTFFCIRDKKGDRHGRNYDEVEEPLEILLNMCSAEEAELYSA